MPHLLVSTGDELRRKALEAGLPVLLPEWDVAIVSGIDSSVEALGLRRYDAIVADAAVAGFEDPVLLRMVREIQPAAARIAVVGDRGDEAGLRLSNVAHQCLALPLTPDQVATTVNRTRRLVDALQNPAVRSRVSQLTTLASSPRVFTELTLAMADPDVALSRIIDIVSQDAAVAAKVLQLANSAFFARSTPTGRIDDAVVFLGFKTLRALVLTVEAFRLFDNRDAVELGVLEGLQTHGLQVARSAAAILAGHPEGGEAFTAGLMHDVGKLVLSDQDPAAWAGALDEAGRSRRPVFAVEQEQFGTTHAEVGAALLDLWGLPLPVVEAVAYHHHPEQAGHSFGLVGAVHVANGLVHELSSAQERTALAEILNAAYLEAAGLVDRLPRWEDLVARQLGV